MTPGSHKDSFGTAQPYLPQFFPSYAADPNAASITPATGLGGDWWTPFNVVVICQAIYYVTSTVRNYLRQPDVNNQVVALNGQLQSHLNYFYAGIVTGTSHSGPGRVRADCRVRPGAGRPAVCQLARIWERNNRWILNNALVYGASKPTLLALWNKEIPADGAGGTQHMAKTAEGRGVKVVHLDATPLAKMTPSP